GVPWRPIVVKDEVVRLRAHEPPDKLWRRTKARDDVVVAAQQPRGFDHVAFLEHRIGERDRVPGVGLALDVLEDLAPFVVHPTSAWRGKPFRFEEAQQRMDSRRPWTGSAPHGVAHAHGIVEIAAER